MGTRTFRPRPPVTCMCRRGRTPIEDMVYYHCDRDDRGEEELQLYGWANYCAARLILGFHGQRFQYWAYLAFPLIVAPLLYARTSFWGLFQQQADGFMYYSVNGWWELPATPVPIDPTSAAHALGGPIIPYPTAIPPFLLNSGRGSGSPAPAYWYPIARRSPGEHAHGQYPRWHAGLGVSLGDWPLRRGWGDQARQDRKRRDGYRELAEQISSKWDTNPDPALLVSSRDAIAAWLSQPYITSPLSRTPLYRGEHKPDLDLAAGFGERQLVQQYVGNRRPLHSSSNSTYCWEARFGSNVGSGASNRRSVGPDAGAPGKTPFCEYSAKTA